jgi:hypothetical protein
MTETVSGSAMAATYTVLYGTRRLYRVRYLGTYSYSYTIHVLETSHLSGALLSIEDLQSARNKTPPTSKCGDATEQTESEDRAQTVVWRPWCRDTKRPDTHNINKS